MTKRYEITAIARKAGAIGGFYTVKIATAATGRPDVDQAIMLMHVNGYEINHIASIKEI